MWRYILLCQQGTIEGHEHSYMLDSTHTFEKGRHVAVCGNTAAMLGEGGMSHLAPHFQVLVCLLCLTLLTWPQEGF